MPTNLSETDSFTSPVVAPAAADARNSLSVRTPLQSLTARTAYLRKRVREQVLANWSQRSLSTTGSPLGVRAIACRNYVVGAAVAEDPILAVLRTATVAKVQRSADGITWTDSSTDIEHDAFDVAYLGGVTARWILAAAGGRIYYRAATDLGAWTLVSGTGADFTAVAASDSMAVAVGVGGRISSSPTGATWTARAIGLTAENLVDVAYGNGLFVAVGQHSTILTSPDGITWTSRRSSPTGSAPSRVIYDESSDRFIVFSKPGVQPTIATFAPATPGTLTLLSVSWTASSLAAGDGTVLAVGESWSVHSVNGGATWSDPSIIVQPVDTTAFAASAWSPSLKCFLAGGGLGVVAPVLAQSMRVA